ncbi:SwmB domain-containing protein [Flavicella sediminum]|uniref:SwmB domain-containing protein n=1 Tax=Flavicella sediminum TaxID=2585141 RepID=UPI00111FA2FD|nr:hypothetical protein [Flavicella sediminum]
MLVLLVLVTSCTNMDEYDVPSGNYSSFWARTTKDNSAVDKICNINDYVAFYDLSRNVLSHEWTTPSETKFLSKEFTEQDSVYSKFVIGNGGKSKEDLINVYFPKAGVYEINLLNTYKDSVAESVFVEATGVWMVDKSYSVDVFADPNPAGAIFYKEEKVFSLKETETPSLENKANWPVINIEAGEELVFMDESITGRADGAKWSFEGGKPETSSKDSLGVVYNKLGQFTATLTSTRKDPSKSVGKYMPVIVQVNPSSKPFTINGAVSMDVQKVISFAVTGEVASVLGAAANFTVHVSNTAAGFDQNIEVASVQINTEDATVLELELKEPIYNTDEVTIAYAGTSLISVDERVLQNFDATPITIERGYSILIDDHVGFEVPFDGNKASKRAFTNQYWCAGTNDDPIFFQRTEEKSYKGMASMKYTNEAGVFTDVYLRSTDFSKPNGLISGAKYVSYKIFLEEGNTMKGFTTSLNEPALELDWDIENLPRGKWVEIGQTITTDEIISGAQWVVKIPAASNPGVTGSQTMYFDDLQMIPLVPRP